MKFSDITVKQVEAMSGADLVKTYNLAALALGRPAVKRFSDSGTGRKRVKAILAELPQEEAKPRRRSSRINYLGMRQDIAPQDEQKPIRDGASLRADLLELARREEGINWDEFVEILKAGDQRTGRTSDFNVRAYQLVRIMCYYLGYGTKSSADGTRIRLIVSREETIS